MRFENVTIKSVKKITDKELLNMHRRCHQLYVVAKKRNNSKMISFIKAKHTIIVKEMLTRKMKHNSPLSMTASLKVISNEAINLKIVDSYLGVL